MSDADSTIRVFLVGCPRSGTTLLQALLGAHSEVASFPESHLFIKGESLPARWAPGWVARKNLVRFIQAIDADRSTPLDNRTLSLSPTTYQTDLIHLLDDQTRRQGRRLWIEKTPNHVLAIPEIRALVPSCKFIHLIRDGRAVVASLYEVTREHPQQWGRAYSLERCVREWNQAIAASSSAIGSGHDGIVIHYQDLAANPEIELIRLCGFLGLDYETQMLTSYTGVTASIVKSDEQWKVGIQRPIQDSGLQKYREIFSTQQQREIEESLLAVPANL